MEILNLGGSYESSERPAKKKKLRVIIGIGMLAGVMGMGSTLAASITLNSGASVEFGQGVTLTAACDSAITVTPRSSFVNAATAFGGANFALTSVEISDIASGCGGKNLTIKAYTDTTTVSGNYTSTANTITSPLAFGFDYSVSGMKFGGHAPASGTGTPINVGCTITLGPSSAPESTTVYSCGGTENKSQTTLSFTSGKVILTFGSATVSSKYQEPILASAVDKFSLESAS